MEWYLEILRRWTLQPSPIMQGTITMSPRQVCLGHRPVLLGSPNREKRRWGAFFALVGLDLAESLLLLREWNSKNDRVVVDPLA